MLTPHCFAGRGKGPAFTVEAADLFACFHLRLEPGARLHDGSVACPSKTDTNLFRQGLLVLGNVLADQRFSRGQALEEVNTTFPVAGPFISRSRMMRKHGHEVVAHLRVVLLLQLTPCIETTLVAEHHASRAPHAPPLLPKHLQQNHVLARVGHRELDHGATLRSAQIVSQISHRFLIHFCTPTVKLRM